MIVGDFQQALIADRMQTTIYISDSHADRFTRNLLTVLAEERVGFGCRAPKAFVQVTP
jgi:HK97 family phage major capsid protein